MSTSIRSGIGKTAIIFPAAFLIAISLGLVMLGSVFLLKDIYQASPIQNALAPAIFHAVYVFACLFFRPLFDRFPVRYPLILSTLSMGLFTTLIVFSNNLWQVYLLFALYGLSLSLFWPPLMGWVSTGLEGKQLSSTLGKYNQCWSCGAILSPFVAGWLSEYNGYFPLIGGAAVMFMTLFLILGAIMVLPTVRKESMQTEPDREKETVHKATNTGMAYAGWIGVFTAFFAMGILTNTFALSGLEELSFSKKTIGFLLLIRARAMTLGFMFMGNTTFWHYKRLPMKGLQGLLGVMMFSLAFAHSYYSLAILMIVIGFCMSYSYSSSAFHGTSGTTSRRRAMAIHEAFLATGLVAGLFFGNLIYQYASSFYVYTVCGVVILGGLLLESWVSKHINASQ